MTTDSSEKVQYGARPLGLDASRKLCEFAARACFEDLPDAVVRECKRGMLDWLGCALAGSAHATIQTLLAGLRAAGSLERVTVIGNSTKMGLMEAAIANGQMGHVLDFDDTHMDGVVLHTSSPVLAALIATLAVQPRSGKDFMLAYALGFEAGVRVGKCSPGHHDGGWHLTGTLGSIAAGFSVASLLGLNPQRTTYALGIATTQAAGMQQNRGTMCKSLHAGKAAANGVLAGLLAREGFDSAQEIIEGRRGFANTFSKGCVPEALTDALGERWEITSNGYKPYACGVVLHPLIDAVIALRAHQVAVADVAHIALRVHPLAIRITGVVAPATGLQSKFSLYHSAAVAYIDGAAGVAQYSDARASDQNVANLRACVQVEADASLRKDEAHAFLLTRDGQRHAVHIPHAIGTQANPLSDAALLAKFYANASPVVGEARAAEIAAMVERFETLDDANALVGLLA